jgi:hypothetical protein
MTDTNDLVARLRNGEWNESARSDDAAVSAAYELMAEAADTIERLTRERDEARALLCKWDALIKHQYTGSREAMSDMQRVAQETDASLRKPGLTKPNCPNLEEGKHD